jgi:hypothetical protein
MLLITSGFTEASAGLFNSQTHLVLGLLGPIQFQSLFHKSFEFIAVCVAFKILSLRMRYCNILLLL